MICWSRSHWYISRIPVKVEKLGSVVTRYPRTAWASDSRVWVSVKNSFFIPAKTWKPTSCCPWIPGQNKRLKSLYYPIASAIFGHEWIRVRSRFSYLRSFQGIFSYFEEMILLGWSGRAIMATWSRAHLKFGGSILFLCQVSHSLFIFPLTVINSSSCEHYCEIKINTYQCMSHVQECIIQIFSLNIESLAVEMR